MPYAILRPPALKSFLETALSGIVATNEPKQIKCGAPDLVLTRNKIPLGYIEAKNVGENLDDKKHEAQLSRYKVLDNLIYTDYLEFRLIRIVRTIKIAEISKNRIKINVNLMNLQI